MLPFTLGLGDTLGRDTVSRGLKELLGSRVAVVKISSLGVDRVAVGADDKDTFCEGDNTDFDNNKDDVDTSAGFDSGGVDTEEAESDTDGVGVIGGLVDDDKGTVNVVVKMEFDNGAGCVDDKTGDDETGGIDIIDTDTDIELATSDVGIVDETATFDDGVTVVLDTEERIIILEGDDANEGDRRVVTENVVIVVEKMSKDELTAITEEDTKLFVVVNASVRCGVVVSISVGTGVDINVSD